VDGGGRAPGAGVHGFTTIRDLGSEGAGYIDVGLRDAAREGLVPGPRMLVAGPAIRSTGRYPLPGQQHSMTFPVEAHRQRVRVAAHSLTLSGARMAVAAGVDTWDGCDPGGWPARPVRSGWLSPPSGP